MPMPHTLPGAAGGDPLPNPVAVPRPGVQRLGQQDAAVRAGLPLRDADAEQQATFSDARPRFETFEHQPPPPIKPAGQDSRPVRHPITNTNDRRWPQFNRHEDMGQKGVTAAGANTPNGPTMNAGTSSHRNTFRLPPEPWDTNIVVTTEGS